MNLFFEPTFRTREFERLLVSRLLDPVMGKCNEPSDCVGSWQRRIQLLSCSSLDISYAEMSSSLCYRMVAEYLPLWFYIIPLVSPLSTSIIPSIPSPFHDTQLASTSTRSHRSTTPLTHPLSSYCSFAMKFVAIFLGLVHLISVAGAAYCGSPCTYNSDCVNTLCNYCTSNQGPVNGVPQGICYQPDA